MENWLFISCKIFSNVLESKNEVRKSNIFVPAKKCLIMQYIVQSYNKEDSCNIPPGWVNKT